MTIRFWANKLLHRNQMTVYTRRRGGEAEREEPFRRRIKIDEKPANYAGGAGNGVPTTLEQRSVRNYPQIDLQHGLNKPGEAHCWMTTNFEAIVKDRVCSQILGYGSTCI